MKCTPFRCSIGGIRFLPDFCTIFRQQNGENAVLNSNEIIHHVNASHDSPHANTELQVQVNEEEEEKNGADKGRNVSTSIIIIT